MSQSDKLTRNKNKNKKRGTSLSERGPSYTPQTKVSTKDLNEKEQTKVETVAVDEPIIEYVPKPTSIKVNTDIKDRVNALSMIGVGDTQLEVIDTLIDYYIDGLPEETERKYSTQYEVYKDKTIRNLIKKK